MAQPASHLPGPAFPECCGRAPQPVPGPAALSDWGSLVLCWVLDPTGTDFLPVLQLLPFPVGWADALCLRVWGLASVSMAWTLNPTLLGSLLTIQILGSLFLSMQELGVGLCMPCAPHPSCEGVRYPWEESQDGSLPGGRKPLTHPGLKSGFSDPVAGLSGFLPPFFVLFVTFKIF